MSKRGQIALFVIIGVLLVAALLLVYFLKPQILGIKLSPEEAQKLVTAQIQPIRDHVEGCMLIVSRKTINTMGRQGGYVIPRTERFSIPSEVMQDAPAITYAVFYDSQRQSYVNYFPSLEEMKEEFADFMERNPEFELCINDFEEFKPIVDVKKDKLIVDRENIDFGEKSGQIVIPFKYAVEINKGNATTIVDKYEVLIPINMAKIHELSSVIIDKTLKKEPLTVFLQERAKELEQEIRREPNTDKIFVRSLGYDSIPVQGGETIFNVRNTLFKLEYESPALDEAYEFNFLTGDKA